MALLTAVSLHLGDGHALAAEVGKGGPHLLQLERLDDGGDELHVGDPLGWFQEPGDPGCESRRPRRAATRLRGSQKACQSLNAPVSMWICVLFSRAAVSARLCG